MYKWCLFILLLLVFVSGCSEEKKVIKLQQENLENVYLSIENEDWEVAKELIETIPSDFHVDVEAIRNLINANLVLADDMEDQFKKNKLALSFIENKELLSDVSEEIKLQTLELNNKLHNEIETVIAEVREDEKNIVKKAYELLWEEDEPRKAGALVKNYYEFKSEYKLDAHILYVYSESSKLIDLYWDQKDSTSAYDSMGRYDNYESYRKEFADKHRAKMITHLQKIDPSNSGHYLPEYIMRNLKHGLENFLLITEREWEQIYNDTETDWVKVAQHESQNNEKLRQMKPKIGMTAEEVRKSKWGKPNKINRTETTYGVSEQWVYPDYRYVYLDDGIVTAIQD